MRLVSPSDFETTEFPGPKDPNGREILFVTSAEFLKRRSLPSKNEVPSSLPILLRPHDLTGCSKVIGMNDVALLAPITPLLSDPGFNPLVFPELLRSREVPERNRP